MTPTLHFGTVSQSPLVSLPDLARISAALNKKQIIHFHPFWGRMSTVAAFGNASHLPLGTQPALVQTADLMPPGALGYHATDAHGRPTIFVSDMGGDLNGICKVLDHEVGEATGDPSGNRLVVVPDPDDASQTVEMLVEVSDPSEALSYKLDGFDMSDFYLPEWLDDIAVQGRRYTYLNAIPTPRTLLPGGYFSYVKNGAWWQKTWWSGFAPITEGPFNWERQGSETLREMVDRNTRERKATI